MAASPIVVPAPAVKAVETDLAGWLERQRALLRAGLYTPLGRLEKVMLEGPTVAVRRNNPLVCNEKVSPALDWYGTGPLLAQNGEHLLVIEPMKPPPALPNPEWTPDPAWAVEWHRLSAEAARRSESFGVPFPAAPEAPMVEQRLEHRAAGFLEEGRRKWLLFYPMNERLGNREAALIFIHAKGWGEIKFVADFAGRHTALLYHPASGQAHFVFGRALVEFYNA